jgi:hypothetical protein
MMVILLGLTIATNWALIARLCQSDAEQYLALTCALPEMVPSWSRLVRVVCSWCGSGGHRAGNGLVVIVIIGVLSIRIVADSPRQMTMPK